MLVNAAHDAVGDEFSVSSSTVRDDISLGMSSTSSLNSSLVSAAIIRRKGDFEI